ncbi:hypothetical protein BGX33_005560 [Mortierella sp. NVP41]|nr:hypothetical protein BGX33_005560 [Mortierella sp. NVP41]
MVASHHKDTAQPTSPSSSAKLRKALGRTPSFASAKSSPPPPQPRLTDDTVSSSSRSSALTRLQQDGGEEMAPREGNAEADESPPGSSTTTVVNDDDDEEPNDISLSAAAESPFLVVTTGRITVRRQGVKESGLNCNTPTRLKPTGDKWIGDLFSRRRLTRSRRTEEDELFELDHKRAVQEGIAVEDFNEGIDDDDDGSMGSSSPVTPRSQFGRWKYNIMMSQSTMKPPKLHEQTEEDEEGEEEIKNDDDNVDDDEIGEGDDTHWPFGETHIDSDPSTPKRRPSKIPQDRFLSPLSPSFRAVSGVRKGKEKDEDDGGESDQDGDISKDDSEILDSFSSSQQESVVGGRSTSGVGGSSSSSTGASNGGLMKPPKLNLKHLGGLPSSPTEISASFHTPPRKRVRTDFNSRPPPAPKLMSPEQVIQFFPTSESPSVLKSLQLRRAASSLDGSYFNHSSTEH